MRIQIYSPRSARWTVKIQYKSTIVQTLVEYGKFFDDKEY